MFPQLAIGALQTRRVAIATGSESAKRASESGSTIVIYSGAATGSEFAKTASGSGSATVSSGAISWATMTQQQWADLTEDQWSNLAE